MLFLCPQWSSGPYISRNFLIWTHFVNASWKNRTYACTFPVQRKEINVVKVRFTMRYSSRKLSNEKVITTACNFWRQIACSFQVLSGNILFFAKKYLKSAIFLNPARGSGQKSLRMLITFFRPEECHLLKVEIWRATVTYSPQDSASTTAVVEVAVVICLKSLIVVLDYVLEIRIVVG